jgi:hypothetical protein
MNYGDFVRDAAPASARHRTTITLSLDLRKAAVLDAALRAAKLHRSIVKLRDAYS